MVGKSADSVTVVELWQAQGLWSHAAGLAKKSVNRSLMTVFSLMIGAAVVGALSSQLEGSHGTVARWLAFTAAVGVALTALARRGSAPDAVKGWIRMRALSEGLKAEIYLYLARVSPFDGSDREEKLRDRTDAMLSDASDLIWHTLDLQPPQRAIPAIHDVDSYFVLRVGKQIQDFFRPKAKEMARRLRRLRWTEFILGAVGVLTAATAGVFGTASVSAWLGVITTTAAAVTAHQAATRLEFQLFEYSRMTAELERIRRRAMVPGQDRNALVQQCEQVLSMQNEAWIARWTANEGSAPGQG